jgi:hypothetical protein
MKESKGKTAKDNAKIVRELLSEITYFHQQLIETRKDRDNWKVPALVKLWRTKAHWSDGSVTEDCHYTKSAAEGVKQILLREGNGMGIPLSVEVVSSDPAKAKEEGK